MLLALLFALTAHAEEPQSIFGISFGGPKVEDEHVLTGAEIGNKFATRVSEQAEEQTQSEETSFHQPRSRFADEKE
jgi:hypothetical protein